MKKHLLISAVLFFVWCDVKAQSKTPAELGQIAMDFLSAESSAGINNSSATIEKSYIGKNAYDSFGYAVANAGDVNGDGYDDVIIGAYRNDDGGSNAGKAYIYFGGATVDYGVDVFLNGEITDDRFGIEVSSAGDVNGDGYDDVLIGAHYNDQYGNNAGKAYIFLGGTFMDNTADVTMGGEAPDDHFGTSVSSAGDLNGDGYSDVIIAADYNDENGLNAGKAYVYFGGKTMDNRADLTMTGETAGDLFGRSVSSAGDFNGDGYDDFLIGASGYNNGRGKAYLFMQQLSGNNNFANLTMTGESTYDYFGTSVSCAGDVNGDGYDDVIVGAPYNGSSGDEAGKAYIYFGGPDMDNREELDLYGEEAGDWLGYSVSSAGDVNGDGYDDVIVGAPSNYLDDSNTSAGKAYIFFGGEAMDNKADIIINGEADYDYFGWSVSSAGDVNGDGYDDVIIGADGNDDAGWLAGKAYIYLGGAAMDNSADITMIGEAANDYFGHSVSSAGDVNGDGYSDVIVGANGGGQYVGKAYIYLGGAAMDNMVDITMIGEATWDNFGQSVSAAGDVNGDGYSDVIVGARGNDDGGDSAGKAYIFFGGSSMDNIADISLIGEASDDQFGKYLSSAGDINDDGFGDVIISAFQNDENNSNAGKVYIYFGGKTMDNTADITMTGESSENYLGESVSSAGDVNGDGYDDVIVSAPGNDESDTNAGKAYIYLSSAVSVKPVLFSVRDVPYDQGGKVQVKWARSAYDSRDIGKITEYIVQRADKPDTKAFWENLTSIPATRQPFYSYTAATPYDFCSQSPARFAYRVMARTDNSNEFWYSDIKTAYSVDNLAPLPAGWINADQTEDNAVQITWEENSVDPDVHYYAVYRSSVDGFRPDSSNIIAVVKDTLYIDSEPIAQKTNYYKIVTYDIHENASKPSPQAAVILTAITEKKNSGIPDKYRLYQNFPNPFNPQTTIHYDLPVKSDVQITVFNSLGQVLTSFKEKNKAAGSYNRLFKANSLSSGIYFYMIKAHGVGENADKKFTQVKKMILIR